MSSSRALPVLPALALGFLILGLAVRLLPGLAAWSIARGRIALIIIGLAVGAFVWAARKGQFNDLTTPAMRVLHDEEGKREETFRDV